MFQIGRFGLGKNGATFLGSARARAFKLDFLSGSLDSRVTFTRASNATYFDSTGTLTTASTNVARFDYNPSTLAARGLLIEEQRTNSIRNNTMVGAVVGNPGTNPTNWTSTAVAGNITAKEIVAIGTENGINYIDVRYTTNGAATFNVFTFESTTQVVAANGQTWTSSAYVKLVGGSLSNLTLANRIIYRTSAGANVTSNDLAFVPTTAALSTQQSTNTFTASGATIERITNSILATASGTSDFTLRIGMPQLEQGAFATSVIATTAAAATRNADVASVNTLTPWFNAVESTLSFEFTPVGMKSVGGTALVSIDNGSNERIALIAASNNGMQNITTVAGVTSANTSSPSTIYAANTTYKVAFAVKLNDAQSFSGGVAGTVTTTALMPSGLTALQFNKTYASATSNNGWIRRFAYYPRRLSSAEGIAITT